MREQNIIDGLKADSQVAKLSNKAFSLISESVSYYNRFGTAWMRRLKRDEMTKRLTVYGMLIAVCLAPLWHCPTAEAFHSGSDTECKECHVGTGSQLQGSDASSTCLRCHRAPQNILNPTGYYVATNDANLGQGFPPSQLTPGGDFAYLKKNYSWNLNGKRMLSPGDRHGHNIIALDYGYYADATNTTAPGGTYPGNILSCVSCHDPHAKIAQGANSTGAYRLLGGSGYAPPSSMGYVFTFDAPVAVAPSEYNRSEALTDTRVAYGKGMSEWCSNCHAKIGQDQGESKYGHPVGNNAKFTEEIIANYATYVNSGALNGRGETSYNSLVPFEEGTDDKLILSQHAKNDGSYTAGPNYESNVMCLTCHRAHASGWDNISRWNMSAEFIIYNSLCPGTDNNTPAECSQGRTAAETQRALYDRPTSLFASYQKGLCNKCHAKD